MRHCLFLILIPLFFSPLFGDEKNDNMKKYKDYTKKVYDKRMVEIKSNLTALNKAIKEGGPLIPQGTVIYNDTGKEISMAVTSYADPANVGVYAPIQDFQEGQQNLYSFDATAFGSMSIADKNYVQLGTPLGSAFFNIDEGYMEYNYEVKNFAGYRLDKNGKITVFKQDLLPDMVRSATMMLNYDVINGVSWGVDIEEDLRVMYFSKYVNLNWVLGYKYSQPREYTRSHLSRFLISRNTEKYYKTPYLYGSIVCISNNMFIGNISEKANNIKNNQPLYKYICDKDTIEGKENTNKWIIEKVNNAQMIVVEDETKYPGVPSYSSLPYAYNWSVSQNNEENLWYEVYSIRTLKPLSKILIKDLEIGKKIVQILKNDKKMVAPPKVQFIRYIGDDKAGLIYFDVKLNIDLYDYAPLVMAVDRTGNVKLLARLWSAVDDVKAIEDSARMGPNFYDYRAVVLPDGGIFTVWNGSKGIGVGKMNIK